jgi:hypothetical protein
LKDARLVRKGNKNSKSIPILQMLIESLGNTFICALLNAAMKPGTTCTFFHTSVITLVVPDLKIPSTKTIWDSNLVRDRLYIPV